MVVTPMSNVLPLPLPLIITWHPLPIIPHSSTLLWSKTEPTSWCALAWKSSAEMAIANLENDGLFFGCAVAKRRRIESRGDGSLRGVRGRRIGLKVGETRAGCGGGFAVEVACRSGHGGYEGLSELMTEFSNLALCASRLAGSCSWRDVPLRYLGSRICFICRKRVFLRIGSFLRISNQSTSHTYFTDYSHHRKNLWTIALACRHNLFSSIN